MHWYSAAKLQRMFFLVFFCCQAGHWGLLSSASADVISFFHLQLMGLEQVCSENAGLSPGKQLCCMVPLVRYGMSPQGCVQ